MNSPFAFILVAALFVMSSLFLSWWLESRGWVTTEKPSICVAMGLSSFVFMLMPVLIDGPIRNRYYERIDDVHFYMGPFIFFVVMIWISVIVERD